MAMGEQATGKSQMKGFMPVIIVVVVLLFILLAGRLMGTTEGVNSLFWVPIIFAAVLIPIFFVFRRNTPTAVVNKAERDLFAIRERYRVKRKSLVQSYNDEAQPIKDEYEKKGSPIDKTPFQTRLDKLRPRYIELEKPILSECETEMNTYIEKVRSENQLKKGWFPESLWAILLAVPIVVTLVLGIYGYGTLGYGKSEDVVDIEGWSVHNLEMVHLQDKSRYVCNPDNVLSQEAVDEMDAKLAQLESEYGIESVVIVVNHIANDDPFRLTQDIFERYGVGRNDQGLVIAVGYQDHSFFMATGHSLEADLTDVECNRLQTDYFDSYARAGLIDDAMTSFINAVVHHLSDGRMPRVVGYIEIPDTPEDIYYRNIVWWGIFLFVWLGLCLGFWPLYNDRLKYLKAVGLLEGPWHNDRVGRHISTLISTTYGSSGSSYRSSSRSSSWSSSRSSSGGHFSGGRSGGGGGGHRW